MDMRGMFTIDGRHFSTIAGFYDEVEQVFTCGLNWKIGRNLNAFNDIFCGGLGRHEYGEPIHIKWIAYKKASVIWVKILWTPSQKLFWILTVLDMIVLWSYFDISEKEK